MEFAAKKRREYLRRKSAAYSMAAMYGCVLIGGVLLAIIGVSGAVWSGFALLSAINSPPPRFGPSEAALDALVITAIIAGGGVAATFLGRRGYRKHSLRAVALLNIPPVCEQIANLPNDAVLLRSSDQFAAVSSDLLRVAHAVPATSNEQLLRAAD